jgi:DUF1680 family protein
MTTATVFVTFLGTTLLLTTIALVSAPSVPQTRQVATFPISYVRLLDGPFKRAQDLNLAYLRALEPDRLLAPYRSEAGLQAKAEKYPNWESTGLDGHTAGHYLTALAQAWAATGDAEMKRRLDYMIEELAACQRAHGNGYVGPIPRSRELWAEVASGRLKVESFGLNGRWVPWYNLHKLYAGLRDAHVIGGNAHARSVLIRLADWSDRLLANMPDSQIQEMLGTEHGGMNEVLADVFALTRDPKYLALARRFSHQALLHPLRRREDSLTGLHANTQIPKVVGYARIAELGGDPAALAAARFFWETVVRRRTVSFGGNSVREHFNPADDFTPMIESREGPETCNTYNMLRLTERLFREEPLAEYADFYERAQFNHILSAQHPERGGFVYFTPIRPRHYRVYSHPSHCFWCCVGSGMESHGKHGQFIYAHAGDDLYVNLFIASALEWPERGVVVRQDTSFPDAPRTRLAFTLRKPQRFTLRVRHPGWVAKDALRIRLNGRPWAPGKSSDGASTPASYAAITRLWRDGDRVEVELPMQTAIERLPDGSDYVSVVHGPLVLAARTGSEDMPGVIAGDGRMAHVSPGPYLPLDSAPMLVGNVNTLAAHIRPVAGRSLTFRAPDIIQPANARHLELVPFFRVHDSRYMVYWRAVAPNDYDTVVARIAADEKSRLALDARTLDRVTPGEQQPEVEHHLRADGSNTGVTHDRTWRDAAGWFSYDLQAVATDGPLELLVAYSAGERGREFDIVVNDRVVASVALDGRHPDRFVDATYVIPADVVAAAKDGVLIVKFVAKPGSRAGAVYDVRLMRP